MKFDLINRRTHLYLGMFLIPWFFMYGVSSLMISHHSWFRGNEPGWDLVGEKEYQFDVDQYGDKRLAAEAILKDNDMLGAFWSNDNNRNHFEITQFNFWNVHRLRYFYNENRLTIERQALNWDQIILRLHFRGGFMQPGFWNFLWAVIVDIVCLAIILWIVSGLIMWWNLKKHRLWGAITIGAGFIAFISILLII